MAFISEIREVGVALRLGGAFAKFFDGVRIEGIPSEPVVRVASCSRSQRGQGSRFVRYSYSVKVRSSNGIEASGYGEGDFKLIAIQKAIAEAIERVTMLEAANFDPMIRTSNGWAAHISEARAAASAKWELVERDTVLINWLTSCAPERLSSGDLPSRVRRFARKELPLAPRFNRLQIFVNAFSAAPVASVLLHDAENRGFISHASGESLERAIESSLSEVCRMTDLYQKGLLTASPSGNLENPDDHALYYVEKESFPSWFFEGIQLTYEHAAQRWRETNQGLAEVGGFSFQKFRCGPLYIARCTHPEVQDLFFGESAKAFKTGILSTERIQKRAHNGEINLSPHCVA